MRTVYYENDDILEMHLLDTPIVKEISQDWNINISFDKFGNVVEIVILDAKKIGVLPAIMELTQPTKIAA